MDDAFHEFVSLKSWDNNDDAEDPFVCTGNFDYDPADEFGLVYNKGTKLYIKVAGDAAENFKQKFSTSLSNYPYPAHAVSLNRDRDKCDELLISSMYKRLAKSSD
ncbi:MAG: hypothetical protein K9W44_10755 [Candidatus Lokiarchaeota archaeon]|nr:hypothetical protein [Candidatus Harpocratesius repetitus]